MIILNADLSRQFEFVQQQWINFGNDFRLANDGIRCSQPWDQRRGPGAGRMVIEGDARTNTMPYFCSNMPTFVETRGGDYFFVPSMTCLRMIGLGIIDPWPREALIWVLFAHQGDALFRRAALAGLLLLRPSQPPDPGSPQMAIRPRIRRTRAPLGGAVILEATASDRGSGRARTAIPAAYPGSRGCLDGRLGPEGRASRLPPLPHLKNTSTATLVTSRCRVADTIGLFASATELGSSS
jgi:hypothetical protein